MKQRLFENVGGNKFILTEGVTDKAALVRGGIKKVFSAGNKKVSYKVLENVGMGYISDITEAKKIALQEAKAVAEHCGYCDDDKNAQFVKEDGEMSDYDRGIAENPVSHSETDMGNPEEKREVRIGKKIEICTNLLRKYLKNRIDAEPGTGINATIRTIEEMAQELIQMHGQK